MIEGHFTETTEKPFEETFPVVHIPTKNVEYWWPHIAHYVESALQYATPPYPVKEPLMEGRLGLYCPMDSEGFPVGVCVLEKQDRGVEHVLHVLILAGGTRGSWDEFWPRLAELAKRLGCAAIEGHGRKGFMKWTERYNMRPIYTAYRVEV